MFDDKYFMRQALVEAKAAGEDGEIPIGAVMVCRNSIIARSHNLTETLHDVTAHAEMMALTAACNTLGGKYLPECTIYVTVEPCAMCTGALGWSHIGRIVYGASDLKRGYFSHTMARNSVLHPRTIVESGVLEDECQQIVTEFFKRRRR